MLEAVNAYKEAHGLGNTGTWYGVIGDQTWDSLIRTYNGEPVLSAQEFANKNDIEVNSDDSVYYNWGKTSDGRISRSIHLDVITMRDKSHGRIITSAEEYLRYKVNVSPVGEGFGSGLYGTLESAIDLTRYSEEDLVHFYGAYGLGQTAHYTILAVIGTQAVLRNTQKPEINNPLADVKYTNKVKLQMAKGDYHGFPESVDAFGMDGFVSKVTGGDGIVRTRVEIFGGYRAKQGVFEYIIEADGFTCNHRLFIPH